jgi:hypothetical protein
MVPGARPVAEAPKPMTWPERDEAAKAARPGANRQCREVRGLPGTSLLGDHSEREPPDPIPNSEVKPLSADDSAAVCRVKVGNRQAPYSMGPSH